MENQENSTGRWKPALVECYSGYRGEETPRAVTVEGVRSEVTAVLSRERVMDQTTCEICERWRCRLDDVRIAILERLADGTWRVRALS
jgi:hypothetical protein